MTFLLVFALSFTLALVATPLAGRIGRRLGLVAVPGGRRQHQGAVPVTGGVGLFAGFFLTALGLYFVGALGERLRLPTLGVLVGAGFVFLAGLADDKFEFRPLPQLAVQIVAAVIAIVATVFIEEVTLPFVGFTRFPWFITYPLTLIWVVGMMNTVNLLDGLDGLAAGVGAIAAILFAAHSYFRWQQPDTPLYSLALAGACLGFLLFNFHPARVFLGSSGAMVLGFALATLSILTPARVATALLVMAIPITDAAFQLFDRWRRGRSPGQGDRGHLHYRLLDVGLSHRQIVIGYWLLCAAFGALALLIPAPHYKLVALGILGLIVVSVLVFLSRKQAQ
jgi:UDP-GlcNAc:undecaprenyl-phosphate GlcNAc-1-phosphate transferase